MHAIKIKDGGNKVKKVKEDWSNKVKRKPKCVFCGKRAEFPLAILEQLEIDTIGIKQNPTDRVKKILWTNTNNEEWICGCCLQKISKLNNQYGVLGEVLRGVEYCRATNKFTIISTNPYGEFVRISG